MKKPNILQLIGEFISGGAETIVIDLINRLKKDNWDVIVSARRDGPLSARLIDKNGIYIINKRRTFDVQYLLKLISLIRYCKIELIHTHLFGNDFYGFLAARFTGAKIIQTIHGMDSINSRKRVLAYRIMAPFVDKIITVSESLEQEFLKVIPTVKNKICTITNGVDIEYGILNELSEFLREEIGISNLYPVIGAVGHVKSVKGYDTLIKAACLIIKKYPNAKIIIVGEVFEKDKHYKEELDRLIYSLGLKEHIKFTGFRQDVSKILPLFDVYVLPSRSEGLSMALLEAMSLGKPIVATSVGGNSFVLENGKTALLVPPDDPGKLSNSILHILSDEHFAKSMGKNALEHVRNKYTIDNMVENYKNLYFSLFN